MIQYQLHKFTDLQLIVYNSLGQKVRTLVNTQQSPGYYQVQWDGRNNFGANVSSGIYIYRLQTSDFVKNRRLVLMK